MKERAQLTREEEAHRDIGRTVISRNLSKLLVFVFITVIGSVPFFQTLFDIVEGESTFASYFSQIVPRIYSNGSFIFSIPTSEDIKDVELAIENRSFLKGILPLVQTGMANLGIGNEQTIIGSDDWLYFAQSIDHITGPGFLEIPELISRKRNASNDSYQPDPVTGIIHFHQQLKKRGITLLVLPIPAKPTIHPEGLGFSKYPVQNKSWKQLIDTLSDKGIHVFDPTQVLIEAREKQNAYLKRDTHWRPESMEAVAQAISQYIAENFQIKINPTSIGSTEITIRSKGDLDAILDRIALPYNETVTIKQIYGIGGQDKSSPVTLLGDSFSNIYSAGEMGWGMNAGFGEQLSRILGTELKTVIRNDNGSWQSREALVREIQRGGISLEDTEAVIWQFAARELSFGDWKLIDLPGDSKIGTREEIEQFTEKPIEARILDISRPPHPNSTPYSNALVAMHLAMNSESQTDFREFLAYTWGMQDHRWLESARWKTGQMIRGKITQWKFVEERLGSLPRIELQDASVLGLPVVWFDTDELTSQKDNTQAVKAKSPNNKSLSDYFDFEGQTQSVIPGDNGWLLLPAELKFLSKLATTKDNDGKQENAFLSDSLPAIIDFKDQLASLGIDLILAPVPPKTIIPADALQNWSVSTEDLLLKYKQLLGQFNKESITTIDLTIPLENLAADRGLAFCKQDSHWSPTGIKHAAEYIANFVTGKSDKNSSATNNYRINEYTIRISGDLWRLLPSPRPEHEEIEVFSINEMRNGLFLPVNPDGNGRILIIGDSHTLVFSVGNDMHSRGGGIAEWLMFYLNEPVGRIGVRGADPSAARISLARMKESLQSVDTIIWIFASHVLAEEYVWRKIQIMQ